MAQTRATSKALAQALRWIPVLAGYSGTPYEEMPPEAHGDREEERLPRADAPSGNGKITKERARALKIYAKHVFPASEAVHGKGGDWDKVKFKSLNWALDKMGHNRLDDVDEADAGELFQLVDEYPRAQQAGGQPGDEVAF